jgi:hypothetical protein
MRVQVTEDDIEHGDPGSETDCAVARAGARSFGCEFHCMSNLIVVGPMWVEDRAEYDIPRSVRRFIKRYDDGAEVRPFSFTLRGPRAKFVSE